MDYDSADANIRIDKNVEKVTHKIDYAKLAELEYQERRARNEEAGAARV